MIRKIYDIYGNLLILILICLVLIGAGQSFSGPVSISTGLSDASISTFLSTVICLAATFVVARFFKTEVIHGLIEAKIGKKVPSLISTLCSIIIIFIGICVVVAFILKRDVTALVATGGASLMIIGIALKDTFVSVFTGVTFNIEKPFNLGDLLQVTIGRDTHVGSVSEITWRKTVLKTSDRVIHIPNTALSNAVLINLSQPDNSTTKKIDVLIDYDTSVESAERILYAATVAAKPVEYVGTPTVFARKLERDGVLYEVEFRVPRFWEAKKVEHLVIKSILECMRNANITVSFPKTSVIQAPARAKISDNSHDVFNLVKQSLVFQAFPDHICERIAEVMIPHNVRARANIVIYGDKRSSLFTIGEGVATRNRSDKLGDRMLREHFIATQSFGRNSFISGTPHSATVTADTPVRVYEFNQKAFKELAMQFPNFIDLLSIGFANLDLTRSDVGGNVTSSSNADVLYLQQFYQGRLLAMAMPRTGV
jgi:small-conductance mechanosensitive channel